MDGLMFQPRSPYGAKEMNSRNNLFEMGKQFAPQHQQEQTMNTYRDTYEDLRKGGPMQLPPGLMDMTGLTEEELMEMYLRSLQGSFKMGYPNIAR